MLLPREAREGGSALAKREMSKQTKNFVVVAIIVFAVFCILVTTYITTFRFRGAHRARKAQQSSGDSIPSLFSWKNFRKRPRRNEYSTSLQDTEYRGSTSRESGQMSGGAAGDAEQQNNSTTAAGVDRNTSVRSVMTLPSYSAAARENERILAREGERGGMDNVIELPETVDEEERVREEEMESLYQIRLARRVEQADREARRQARRDARARGDIQALADLRRRAEEAADLSVSQLLIAEHQARQGSRDRRVSSVQYGDLGVARHDGTRLRANSSESDVRPLLDSAASISGQSYRTTGNNTLDHRDSHQRGLSVTSIPHSFDSDEYDLADASRSHSHSRSNLGGRTSNSTSDDFEVVSLHPERSRSGSHTGIAVPSPTLSIPREDAPAYEDPPNYESPVNARAPQLPVLERLPSIQVTGESTGTPAEGRAPVNLR